MPFATLHQSIKIMEADRYRILTDDLKIRAPVSSVGSYHLDILLPLMIPSQRDLQRHPASQLSMVFNNLTLHPRIRACRIKAQSYFKNTSSHRISSIEQLILIVCL